MYCGKCGAQLDDDAVFCTGCGSKVGVMPIIQESNSNRRAPRLKKRKNKVIFAVLGIVLIAVIAGCCVKYFTDNGYKGVVRQYIEAEFDGDAETILYLLPEEFRNKMLEEAEDELDIYGEDELIAYIEERLDTELTVIENIYGDKWKYSYNIIEEIDYTESSEDNNYDLTEFNHDYREMGITGFKSEAVKDITLEITFTTKNGDVPQTTETVIDGKTYGVLNNRTLTLVKINNKWYINYWNI